MTRLDGQSSFGASPELRPQSIPLCRRLAVPAWGIGRLSPVARRAVASRERAPSIAVSIRSSSRELPCWEHRDAPVVTTLRGTATIPLWCKFALENLVSVQLEAIQPAGSVCGVAASLATGSASARSLHWTPATSVWTSAIEGRAARPSMWATIGTGGLRLPKPPGIALMKCSIN